MDFYGLCDYVLQEGCGTTLEEVLNSERYKDNLQEQALMLVAPTKEERVALKAGHLEFGTTLNAYGEDAALARIKAVPGYVEANSIDDAALLQTMGELILEKIWDVCLPEDIKKLAEEWQGADSGRQIEIAYEVYGKVREYTNARKDPDGENDEDVEQKEKEKENKELGKLDFMAYWLDSIFYDRYTAEQVMPLKIGNIEGDGLRPNCLGMALLLLGFAKRTGARFMLTSMFRDASAYIHAFERDHVYPWFEELCKERGLDKDKDIQRIFRENKAISEAEAEKLNDFHYSLSIAANDGRWVHVDPYLRNFAVFPEVKELEYAYRMLGKYSRALPGMSFILDSTTYVEEWLRERWQELEDDLEIAEILRQAFTNVGMEIPAGLLNKKATGIQELREIEGSSVRYYELDVPWMQEKFDEILESDDVFTILLQESELRNSGANQYSEKCVFYNYDKVAALATLTFPSEILKWEDGALVGIADEERYDSFYVSFLDDEEYREELMAKMSNTGVLGAFFKYLLYVRNAIEGFKENNIPHPVLEFFNPAYGLAVAVLNHVACYTETTMPNDVFLNHTSSQVFWHDTVDLSQESSGRQKQTPLTKAFESFINMLPDIKIHPLCKAKLSILETQGERKERQDVRKEEVPGTGEGRRDQGSPAHGRGRLRDPAGASQSA